MRSHLKRLILPVLAAGVAWFAVPASFWAEARMALLAALSVIAAAVMVRLARGLPFTNADHFEVAEIRQVTAAIKQIMRALAALIFVVIATMVILTFSDRVVGTIAFHLPAVADAAGPFASSTISFLLTYVLVRIFDVVRSDINLVDLQSKFLIRAVERKEGKKLEDLHTAACPGTFKQPASYGRLVQ